MRRYLEILRTPHVGALFAASLLARLPMGINGLASGLGAPLTARLIDRLGARTLLALAGLSAAGILAVVGLARAGAPTAALIAAAFLAGAAFPPTSSVLRTQYPRLFGARPALLQGAFALDSVLTGPSSPSGRC